jgi:hypothetical protein
MMSQKIGDFPIWAAIVPFAPAALCMWLGLGFPESLLVYLGLASVLAILVQLDRIEQQLEQLNDRSS